MQILKKGASIGFYKVDVEIADIDFLEKCLSYGFYISKDGKNFYRETKVDNVFNCINIVENYDLQPFYYNNQTVSTGVYKAYRCLKPLNNKGCIKIN